jgi:hypothetical protein
MSDSSSQHDDPAIVGVPPETPDDVRPSTTGLVAGPVEEEPEVELADPRESHEGRALLDAGGERVSGAGEDPEIEGPNSR